MSDKKRPPMADVERLLADHHGATIRGLAPIGGGFWSSAYTYDLGNQALVLRLADDADGYKMDQAAHSFTGPDLPVPEVLAIGDAFGGAFAISRRATGRFLEDVGPDERDRVGPMLDGLFAALRAASPGEHVDWFTPNTPFASTWRGWLERTMADDPASTVSGWREQLATDPKLDDLFDTTVELITELLPQCPERRDLVHGDLLHQNVLVSPEADKVNAVFSWKCSVLGDFLYDVAWCTFWSPWHPGIASVDIWPRMLMADLDDDSLIDAAIRRYCYELHIGVQHLAWCAWTKNRKDLQAVANRTAEVLATGPKFTS